MNPLTDLEMFIPGKSVLFTPCPEPPGMSITPDGLFSGIPTDDSYIYDIVFRVTDNNSISSTKRLQFTSGPALSFVIHGGDDNTIDYSDTVRMDATLVNLGSSPLTGCTLSLALDDPYVEMLKDFTSAGTVPAGGSVVLNSCFEFVMAHETPDNHPIWLETQLDANQGSWSLDIPEKAAAPLLNVRKIDILDGNNGILEAGETANVVVTLINEGHSDMTGVTGQLNYIDPVLELLSGTELYFGDLIRGYTSRDTFEIHAYDSTPNGYEALIGLTTQCDQLITNYDSLYLQLGRKPALVIDLDPHFNSGPVIYETMQELGIISEYRTNIPGNLDDYQSLFVCLGYYNSYHELTWIEGNTLAAYLEAGGNLYMEGRVTWNGSIGTPVHDKFNIKGTGTPSFFYTLEGIDSTFVEGIEMNNGALQPACMYWLEPIPPAFSIMRDTTTLHPCAIAHDGGVFRTIGTIFELGSLEDGYDPSTKAELILRFLDFFGIDYSLTGVKEHAPAAGGLVVSAYPNPFSDRISLRFEIENPSVPVTFAIYDLSGRLVRNLAKNRRMPAGKNELQWDGRNDGGMEVSPGIYFYRMISGGKVGGGKLVLIN
jgi:hypothetical protein